MIDIFSNRELSIIIWFSIFIIIFLTSKSIRKGLKPVISALFSHQLIDIVLMLIIYVELIIFILAISSFWNLSFLKDSISWFIFAGIPLVFSFQKVNSEKNHFKSILSSSIKGIILVEFIANFYSFTLVAELIIIPVITFIGIMQVMSEFKPEHNQVSNFLKTIMGIIGLTIFGLMVYRISQNFSDFLNINTLKTFMLPIVLTILTLPFLYFVALYSIYQTMILRMSRRLKKKKHKRYLKMKLIQNFHINRPKLRKFQQTLGFEPIMNKSDIKNAINKFGK